MESHIITIEPQRNHSMKCLNALKQLNNKLNTLIGNNIVLLKVKNSTTTPLPENLTGNFLIKSNNTNVKFRNKSANKKRSMEHFKLNKNFLNKKKSKRKLFLFLKLNQSISTRNGSLVLKCVKMIKDGL